MTKYWLILVLFFGSNANNQHLEYGFMRELQRSMLTEEKIDRYIQEYGSTDLLYRPGTLENAARHSNEMVHLLLMYSKKINRPFSIEYIAKMLREHYSEQLEHYCMEVYFSEIIAKIPRDIMGMEKYMQHVVCTYGYLPRLTATLIFQLAITGNVDGLAALLNKLCGMEWLKADFIEQLLHEIIGREFDNSEAVVTTLVDFAQRLSGMTQPVQVFLDERAEVSIVSTDQHFEAVVEPQNPEPMTIEQIIISTLQNLYPEISEELQNIILVESMSLLRQQPSSSRGYSEEQLVHVLNEAMLTATMNGMAF